MGGVAGAMERVILQVLREIAMRETTREAEKSGPPTHPPIFLTDDRPGFALPGPYGSTHGYRSSSSADCRGQAALGSFGYPNRFPTNASRRSAGTNDTSRASLYRWHSQPRLPRAESQSHGCDDACVCRFRVPHKLASQERCIANSSRDRHSATFARGLRKRNPSILIAFPSANHDLSTLKINVLHSKLRALR